MPATAMPAPTTPASLLSAANLPAATLLQRLPQPIRNVVVFRALRLGDMLCAVPALRALRAALPLARITLVGLPWAAQFARRFSAYLDDFIAFPGHPALPEQPVEQGSLHAFYQEMHARRYCLGVQLHGSGAISNGIVRGFAPRAVVGYGTSLAANGPLGTAGNPLPTADVTPLYCFPYVDHGPEPLRLLQLMTLLGAPAMGSQLEFPLDEDDRQELAASGLPARLRGVTYLCIHPGAGQPDKCWPPAQFAAVADRLAQEYGLATVLTGAPAEAALTAQVARHMRTPSIDAAGPLSIGAMAALMAGARLLVCNDTGVSHIAAGLGLKSVVIFNKADPQRWAPLDAQRHRWLHDPDGKRAAEVLALARVQLDS